MQDEATKFLNLKEQPGVLSAEQTAWKTGFSVQELSILARDGVLRPLGYPLPQNSRRDYARVVVERFCQDIQSLERGRKAVMRFHRSKNEGRRDKDQ